MAIHPDKAETILSAVILPKLRGEPVPSALSPAQGRGPSRRPTAGGTIGVLPVEGTLVRRAGAMNAESGLQSYDALAESLREMAADPGLDGIVLAFDSPGGEVAGLAETAALVRSVAKAKPVYAVADSQATSAAYWLASAADRVFVTDDSVTGSIGVLAVHVDKSALDAKAGLSYTPVFAGARKVDLSAHAPLNDEGRAFLQAMVDRTHARFVEAVAKYRGVGQAAVRGTEAAVYLGRDAIDAGLADEAGGVEQAVAAMTKHLKANRSAAPVRAVGRPASTHAPVAPAGLAARRVGAHATLQETTVANRRKAGADPAEEIEERDDGVVEQPVEDEGVTAPEPERKDEGGEEPKAPAEAPAEAPETAPSLPGEPDEEGAPRKGPPSVDRIASAQDMKAYAARVARVCAEAGLPALAAGFIEKETPLADIGEQLVTRMARSQQASAVSTAHVAATARATPPINARDVYAKRAAATSQAARN